MLTSRADEVDKIRGFSQGADDYLTKPFSLAELEVRGAILKRHVTAAEKQRLILRSWYWSGAAGGNTQSRANTFNRSRIRPLRFSQPSR